MLMPQNTASCVKPSTTFENEVKQVCMAQKQDFSSTQPGIWAVDHMLCW